MFIPRVLLAFLFLLTASFVPLDSLFAQSNSAGIQIIPASIEGLADPGEVITEDITITNVSDEDKTFYIFTRNIKGVESNGVPVFADDAEKTGYEITEWLSFDSEEVEVPAGGEYNLTVNITVPENATPGSHFGGIFVSQEPPRLREIGAGVGYEVASIISIRISGEVIDNSRIRSFSTDKLIYGSKDVTFLMKVENQGNILIRPRGPLTIRNMFGDTAGTLVINDSRAGVFPGTVRDFSVTWNDDSLGFGQYEAVAALVYDGDTGQKTIDAALTFWIFPQKLVLGVIAGLIVLLGGGYFLIRTYVRRAVARGGGDAGGRRVSRRYRQKVGVSKAAFVFMTLLTVTTLLLIVLFVLFA